MQFQQTTRYSLKLEIFDDKRYTTSAKRSRRDSVVDIHIDDDERSFRDAIAQSPQPTIRQARTFSDCENSWIPSYTNTPLSKLCSPAQRICLTEKVNGCDSIFDGIDKVEPSHVVNRDPRKRFSAFLESRPDWLSSHRPETRATTPKDVNTIDPEKDSSLYVQLPDQAVEHGMTHTLEHMSPQKRKASTYMHEACYIRRALSDQSENQGQDSDIKRRRLQHKDADVGMDRQRRRADSAAGMGVLWND